MAEEANLVALDGGLVPEGDGWFVLNARDARWDDDPTFGRDCAFEHPARRFRELGFHLGVLEPGQPNCMYHTEDAEEDFLVLSGECLLLVEGEERRLRAWDFVHCPPWTEHVFVGAGDAPCLLLAVGTRRPGDVLYPRNDVALRRGAGVETTTEKPREAYASFPEPTGAPYHEGDLPDFGAGR